MSEHITLPTRCEYDITVENLILRVLITRDGEGRAPELSILNLHAHAYCELFVCTEGCISIETANGAHPLSAGMLAFVPAGISHICRWPDSARFVSIGLLVSRRRISGTKNLHTTIARLLSGQTVRVLETEASVIDTLKRIGTDEEPDSFGTPLTMLTTLMTLSEERSHSAAAHGDINRIAQLEQLIHANFHQELTLEVAAAKLFLSKSQLSRMVRALYSTSFHKIVTTVRLDAAAKLLREGNATIDQVGQTVGFQSRSCFYRAFRARYGMTPAEYRSHPVQ
ncbi:MAG: helix-turn-helix domain-containing protein [Clostridia bacterium]|nr:helix-turn-helix domain-containing protein [Clostridia bacterium]